MNQDAAYVVFFAFALIWVAIGTIGLIVLLKSDGQPLRFGKWGLVVALPIVIPFIAALLIGAWLSFTHLSFFA